MWRRGCEAVIRNEVLLEMKKKKSCKLMIIQNISRNSRIAHRFIIFVVLRNLKERNFTLRNTLRTRPVVECREIKFPINTRRRKFRCTTTFTMKCMAAKYRAKMASHLSYFNSVLQVDLLHQVGALVLALKLNVLHSFSIINSREIVSG